jgi:hypothetical protein
MKNIKAPNLFFVIIALIIGRALYRDFDFENLEFENTALAIIYMATLAFTIYFLIKDSIKPTEK